MTKAPAPSDLADKFMLRMPPGMRERISASAKKSNRSMNAEIVHILEEWMDTGDRIQLQPMSPDAVAALSAAISHALTENSALKEWTEELHRRSSNSAIP